MDYNSFARIVDYSSDLRQSGYTSRGTDCTYPSSWDTGTGYAGDDSSDESDLDSTPELEENTKNSSTSPEDNSPPPELRSSKPADSGIKFEEFLEFYSKPANRKALDTAIQSSDAGTSFTLYSLVKAIHESLPSNIEHIRLRNAFEHAQRDLGYLREQFAAYAAENPSNNGTRAKLLFTTSARLASDTNELLREHERSSAAVFSSRFDGPRSLRLRDDRPTSPTPLPSVNSVANSDTAPRSVSILSAPDALNTPPDISQTLVQTSPRESFTASSAERQDTWPSIAPQTSVSDASSHFETAPLGASPETSPPTNLNGMTIGSCPPTPTTPRTSSPSIGPTRTPTD